MSATQQKKAESTGGNRSVAWMPRRGQHRWLQRLVGDWTFETEDLQPSGQLSGQPSGKATGREHVRALGDIWILAEGEGEMPGGTTGRTLMTLGYDPVRRRVVGTWIGSMMTHHWVYDGEFDAARDVLTLESDGPSMAGDGTMARYRDVMKPAAMTSAR